MKKLVLVLTALFIFSIANQGFAQKKENKTVCFKSNLNCVDCEKTVYEHLKFEKGVKGLKIDHVSNTILVEYKEGKSTDESLAKAIEKKGYKAEKIDKKEYEKIVAATKEAEHDHDHEKHQH